MLGRRSKCKLTTRYSVRSNQKSPLLRLPPEIRTRIWEYALGGRYFLQHFLHRGTQRFSSLPSTQTNACALLQVCRQIYAETALIPIVINTFSVSDYQSLARVARTLPKYQRGKISEVQFEIPTYKLEAERDKWLLYGFQITKFSALPGLRRVRVCLFPCDNWKVTTFHEYETRLRSCLETGLRARGYDLLVEKMDIHWSDYRKQ
jgi:hypothetical protein